MKLVKTLLAAVATLITAILAGVAASVVYRRLKYPHVPVQETDVFFDIGLVFFLGFAAVITVAIIGWILLFRKRRRSKQHPPEPRARLEPECHFFVRLSDSEVVCERPDGKVERVAWSDLQKVEVVTTSDGPMLPDVFWVLHGTSSGCGIPQGATGEQALLERLQKLPGFDNRTFIEAMSCSSDRRFLCWQRTAAP